MRKREEGCEERMREKMRKSGRGENEDEKYGRRVGRERKREGGWDEREKRKEMREGRERRMEVSKQRVLFVWYKSISRSRYSFVISRTSYPRCIHRQSCPWASVIDVFISVMNDFKTKRMLDYETRFQGNMSFLQRWCKCRITLENKSKTPPPPTTKPRGVLGRRSP